jgi:hypothetical protein
VLVVISVGDAVATIVVGLGGVGITPPLDAVVADVAA